MKLLLIEPKADLIRHWQALLMEEDHPADIAFDRKIGVRLAVQHAYDGILLHVDEPVFWVRRLRQQAILIPVLILLSPTDNSPVSLPTDVYWVDYYRLAGRADSTNVSDRPPGYFYVSSRPNPLFSTTVCSYPAFYCLPARCWPSR